MLLNSMPIQVNPIFHIGKSDANTERLDFGIGQVDSNTAGVDAYIGQLGSNNL